MRTLFILIAIAMLAFGPPARAACPIGTPNQGVIELGAGTAATTFYLDDRGVTAGGEWVYQESNNIFTGGNVYLDLQEGGCGLVDCDKLCPRIYNPDVAPDRLII